MAILGISTLQTLVVILVVLSLLVLTALLWKNHRDSDNRARPVLVLADGGTLCPVDPVALPVRAIPVRPPVRAPPLSIAPAPGALRLLVASILLN